MWKKLNASKIFAMEGTKNFWKRRTRISDFLLKNINICLAYEKGGIHLNILHTSATPKICKNIVEIGWF